MYDYSKAFDNQLINMPKVLAAFDARWGDARTNLSTYLQLQLRMDRRDNKADGVLNGPTTEAWFDHWYRYLTDRLGVEFPNQRLVRFEADSGAEADGHRRTGELQRRDRGRGDRRGA